MNRINSIFLFLSLSLIGLNISAQDCVLDKSHDLSEINAEIKVLEISSDFERMYNSALNSFEHTETNYLEKNAGYSFLNQEKIPFAYIGFYREHNAMWDTYSNTFISRMPEKMTEGCQINKEYIGAMVGSYFNQMNKNPETVDQAKCLTIEYLIQALKNDCANISQKHHLRSMGFDIIPTKGLELRDKKN